jgi:heat shock protein HslJ
VTNQALRQALARAWVVLVALALAACGSAAPPSSASPGFSGYDWQVVAIGHAGKVTPIPARLEVALQFSPGGQFVAFDGISGHSGTYRATRDGFSTGVLAVTGNGYAGHDPAILLARPAVDSFDGDARATVSLTGDRLVVSVGSYTLTCRRASPQGATAAPAGTG